MTSAKKVTGIDITTELLVQAIQQASIADVGTLNIRKQTWRTYHLKIKYLMLYYLALDTCLLHIH